MARTDNLNNFLTDVAESIRTKKGTTELIPASNFDTEINSIETGGGDINDYFINKPTAKTIVSWIKKLPTMDFSNLKNDAFYELFRNMYNLKEVKIINSEQVSGWANYMFYNTTLLESYEIDGNLINCKSHNSLFSYSGIKEIKNINTSNSTNLGAFANYCSNLTDIDELDGSNVIAVNAFCVASSNLVNFGGIKNLGKAYLTTQNANYSLYGLDLSTNTNLTHESLMNVINNLYDIASAGVQTQKLTLGSTNLAKLTEEEIAIANNKGWTIA